MSKIKTPQEKKRLSFKKDHVVDGGENDKAFRKKWPRKKAHINRAHRRKAAQVLASSNEVDADHAESAIKPIKRPKVEKWGVRPLGESVAEHLASRIRNHGARKARRGRPPVNILAVHDDTGNA